MQSYATLLLGRPVDEWIEEVRGRGRTWREVEAEFRERTGLDLSYETLRAWAPKDR